MQRRIRVSVLSTAGCANTPPTVRLIEDTAEELGLTIELVSTPIDSREQAEVHRFSGSPTVRIEGLDIDPTMRDCESYHLT